MPKKIIEVNNLNKTYQTGEISLTVLKDISFTINQGEFVAIMGPSGSGKSTLMHILGALDLPTSGTYYLNQKNIKNLSADQLAEIRNYQIGFVFQAYNLLPRVSALNNVCLPLDYAGVSDAQQQQRAREVLGQVDLLDRLDHPPNKLSGGQQQRVAIARALVMKPAIILADEPTGNLASTQADEIMTLFTQLNQKGHTIVMITHEKNVAKRALRVIQLLDGKIINDVLQPTRS
jgi:putative ABC transport system ATP-binding protein